MNEANNIDDTSVKNIHSFSFDTQLCSLTGNQGELDVTQLPLARCTLTSLGADVSVRENPDVSEVKD